ncbi:hypothetical protein OE88DRAFT_1805666 [Heliocybe sulcata]|uniref:NADH dehydrogenase [ubiquinone] 1 beta subcomplex subunit 4 n=1 Tax=Heliocybe sulcata TaxID=5364 RepID=A0A5C3ND79_9AGAM|nr:hypothetical protein OE88DRAFT_1805666 [Heliocybe sulcata]
MAGGSPLVKYDPAIERWNAMRENAYQHFRFTPRNTIISLLGMVIVPGTILYVASQTDERWNWNGKRRGESLLSRAPEPESS